MSMHLVQSLVAVCFCVWFAGCSPEAKTTPPEPDFSAKIKFDLDAIHPDGLRGRPDGLVSVSYEFCIPKEEAFREEVRRIDPSVRIHAGSRGRIGCSKEQALWHRRHASVELATDLMAARFASLH